jgi:transcriptional regulator with XRE-family HTH domain
MDETVPNNIARLRKERGQSQSDLASALGISVTQLSRLERGTSSLKQMRVQTIARELGVSPEELFQTKRPRERVDLELIHQVIVQLERLLAQLEINPSPEQRADLTVELYRLETDGLELDDLTDMKIDLRKYEGMLRSMAKR